ncbi:uncharacterized protein TNCT_376601 [Trichonephila clavata]|uniref:Thyroglobulin type-1 domain-containing protein n=1 Tax=Trichonephila clavata TaxID=2740835 RepID=A0A8X6GDG2_TRICU|nr:uncharacterized protein TNCT_376601 [Trichonephila clavata]
MFKSRCLTFDSLKVGTAPRNSYIYTILISTFRRNSTEMFTIAAIFTFVFLCILPQDISAETTCQIHKRNAGGGGNALMQWDIQCDAQGNYQPLQCTRNTPKWCACYDKERMITSPSKSTKTCQCYLAKSVALLSEKPACEVPVCLKSGKYQKRQCCEQTRKCRCVNEITGETVVPDTANMNLSCP